MITYEPIEGVERYQWEVHPDRSTKYVKECIEDMIEAIDDIVWVARSQYRAFPGSGDVTIEEASA